MAANVVRLASALPSLAPGIGATWVLAVLPLWSCAHWAVLKTLAGPHLWAAALCLGTGVPCGSP